MLNYPLKQCELQLRSYTGEQVPILGVVNIPVRYGSGPVHMMNLVVVKGDRPSLLGRDWLSQIKLDWQSIFSMSEVQGEKRATRKNHPDERTVN